MEFITILQDYNLRMKVSGEQHLAWNTYLSWTLEKPVVGLRTQQRCGPAYASRSLIRPFDILLYT